MIKPSFLFTDHAVLQRDKEITVFGECDCEGLTVSYLGYSAEAKTENGKFEAVLPPMPAGLAGELVFSSESETLILKDVLTGDVWLAGGQSNMEHPLFCTVYNENDCSRDNGIRLFTVPRRPYKDARIWGWHFYSVFSEDTPWQVYDTESAMGFSAVAAFFARRLRESIDIPIGVIACNWGATSAEAWTGREKLLEDPVARYAVDKYDERFGDTDMEEYTKKYEQFQRDLMAYNESHDDAMTEAQRLGIPYFLRNNFSKTIPEGPYHYHTPGVFRETMLARVTPFPIKGVIWYQGESNAGVPLPSADERKRHFHEVMKVMIADWREAFRDPSLPFYTVELSAYPGGGDADGTSWCEIREVQELMARENNNIYTVVSLDVGETDNIHPMDKRPIGERLALAALANEYGLDIPWQSPTVDSAEKRDGKYVLRFKNARSLICRSESPRGFFITKGGTRLPTDAEICGDTVTISAQSGITCIGYCNKNYAIADIYNEHMLPLCPFELTVE